MTPLSSAIVECQMLLLPWQQVSDGQSEDQLSRCAKLFGKGSYEVLFFSLSTATEFSDHVGSLSD